MLRIFNVYFCGLKHPWWYYAVILRQISPCTESGFFDMYGFIIRRIKLPHISELQMCSKASKKVLNFKNQI